MQIEILQNFASQAVIAIENTRLLNELRQRTADLTESLEQQTATSEVLRVISSSPGELEPVFEAMLQNAVRICGAKFGNLFVYEGEFFRIGATHGAPHAYVEYLRREGPFRADPRLGLAASPKRSNLIKLPISRPSRHTKTSCAWRQSSWRAPEPCWACRCSKMAKWSAPSSSTARKCARSRTSRSSWSKTLPPRRSSPSRTRGCSRNCASAR